MKEINNNNISSIVLIKYKSAGYDKLENILVWPTAYLIFHNLPNKEINRNKKEKESNKLRAYLKKVSM